MCVLYGSSVSCLLMVEVLFGVVNVMLSLMSVMSPPPALCNLLARHSGEVIYFWCVCFRGELGFLNCDDICMCVMNKQFELLEFVFDSVMLTRIMMRFLSLLLLGMCPCVVSVVMWSSLVCL